MIVRIRRFADAGSHILGGFLAEDFALAVQNSYENRDSQVLRRLYDALVYHAKFASKSVSEEDIKLRVLDNLDSFACRADVNLGNVLMDIDDESTRANMVNSYISTRYGEVGPVRRFFRESIPHKRKIKVRHGKYYDDAISDL